jgi:hypothetical protein
LGQIVRANRKVGQTIEHTEFPTSFKFQRCRHPACLSPWLAVALITVRASIHNAPAKRNHDLEAVADLHDSWTQPRVRFLDLYQADH